MGKSENGAIWLDEKFLSAYDYWQFWRNTDDRDVVKFLKIFTDLETSEINDLKNCNIYIVTVPTPVNEDKTPNLNPITEATLIVSGILKKDDIVIFESTVYPGCTEEDCVPVLEKYSNLKYNSEFYFPIFCFLPSLYTLQPGLPVSA